MSSPLDSQAWYRVRDLRPRLRRHVRVHRHRYRGERWFVLENPSTGRIHRVDQYAYRMLAGMDGRRTLDRVWLRAGERYGDLAPTQDQTIELLGQLHAADILHCDVPGDTQELFDRADRQERSRFLQAFRSPFFVRIPLLDPERWLQRCTGLAGRIFSRWALLAWITLMAGAGVLAAANWQPLVADARISLLSPFNLLLLWLLYPLIKGLHELGHALAVKRWGGEVHDMGVMFLVFMPVPYVNATAANAFPDKRARIAVAGAGIAVELALAAVALLVWLAVEPGLVRTVAIDTMVIGGVSTLLFNGNPLLKFDGYYMLADFVEIPNLASRSSRYYGYLLRRYALGIHGATSPARSTGERNWFAGYGLAAFLYRMFILAAILLFVAGISLTVAVVLGIWAIVGQILLPWAQNLHALSQEPQVRENRLRGVMACLLAALVSVGLLAVPVPHRTMAEGVVWMGDDTRVRVGTDCFVEELLAKPGATVAGGTPLIRCADPFLEARLALVSARRQELLARRSVERSRDRAGTQLIDAQLNEIEQQLADVRERMTRLVVRSPADGVFVMPAAVDLPGRFVPQGELLGYVVDTHDFGVRVAVTQTEVALVRHDTRSVSVRLSDSPGEQAAATIARVLPGATRQLPTAALGSHGGGTIVVDPADEAGRTAQEPVFLLDLTLDDAPLRFGGSRAHVRFEHAPQSLARQWYRDLRQLLLRRLAV